MMKTLTGVALALAILASSAGEARALSISQDQSPGLLAVIASLDFDVNNQHGRTVILTFPSPISVADSLGGVPVNGTDSIDWLQGLIQQVTGSGVMVIHLDSALAQDFSTWVRTFAADYWRDHPPVGYVGGNSVTVSGPGTAVLIGSGVLLIAVALRRRRVSP